MIVILALGLGAAAGWIRGGRLRNLEQLKIRYVPGILVLFVVQSVLRSDFAPLGRLSAILLVWLWCMCVLATAFLALANRRVRGFILVSIGLLSNALVVVANGAMPLSLSAASRLGISAGQVANGLQDGFYVVVTDQTRLWLLGDVLPLPAIVPGMGSVLSIGDVLMLVGVAIVIADGMLPDAGQPGR